MNDFTLISIIFAIVFGAVGILIFFIKREKKQEESFPLMSLLKQDIKEIRDEIKESREKNINFLEGQMQESGKLIKDVTVQLEKMHSDNKKVVEVKDQLDKLTDVLANPKQRGILGEYFLDTLLKNIFQPYQYKLQYQFEDGEIVDAAIFVKDKIIPVDAKFSLENYNRILEEKDPIQKLELEKIFKNDLKNRIEETAKYIRPEENTMDFAFMFIPSEGIYYDLLVNQIGGIKSSTYDLIEYAFRDKRVIIVSPTSFYAYLQTVLQGLKALQIEQQTQKIIKRVEVLHKHLNNYDEFLEKLGKNLSTTVSSYNKTYKEFGKIDKDISKLTEGEQNIKPLEIDKPTNLE
ncbi:MAG: DNA recombination protein RmuC [Patescibacteria group bacterium]